MYAMQPGDTITPGAQPPEPQNQQQPFQAPAPPVPEQPAQAPLPPAPEPPQAVQQVHMDTGVDSQPAWQFNNGEENYAAQEPALSPTATVSWTASEYVAHDKNAGWYVLVMLAAAAVAGIVYLVTRDLVSPVVVMILGGAFAVFGARQPQVLEYAISNTGVHIGQKQYPYGLFRTFSIIEEDATRSILLMPLQRFNLPISVYYDPADEQQIVEALAAHLPHEDRAVGPIDNFMRKIRF